MTDALDRGTTNTCKREGGLYRVAPRWPVFSHQIGLSIERFGQFAPELEPKQERLVDSGSTWGVAARVSFGMISLRAARRWAGLFDVNNV